MSSSLEKAGRPVNAQPAPLPAKLDSVSASDISGLFGYEFTLALRNLPLSQWQGPMASGLGLHLVRVSARAAPSKPSLATVRQRVTNDWRAAAIAKAQSDAYNNMLGGYDVKIELPK